MDESAYRQVLSASIARPCPFERSILSRCAACSKAEKHNVAEREVVACSGEEDLMRCNGLYAAFRHSFAFALHRLHADGPLPHGQEMRVQCGGLKGLRFALDGNADVDDVNVLVFRAMQTYGDWDAFPHEAIVQWAAANYHPRRGE